MAKDDAVGFALARDFPNAPPAGPDFFPPVTTEDINPSINEMTHEATLGTRAPEAVQRGGRTYAGGINGGSRPDSFPAFFAWAMGDAVTTRVGTTWSTGQTYTLGQLIIPTAPTTKVFEVTTAGTGGTTEPSQAGAVGTTVPAPSGTAVYTIRDAVYRHTYNPVGAGKRPLPASVWTDNKVELNPDIVDRYDYTFLNELGMSVEPNDFLLYTAGVIARRLTDQAGVMPTITRQASELSLWAFNQVSAQLAIPSIAAGAYQDHALANWSMTYGNNFNADNFGLGSLETRAIRPGNITLGLSLTAFDAIELHYRRALLQTPEYVALKIVAQGVQYNPTATLAANKQFEEIGIDFKRLQYTEAPVNISATDVLVSIPITAQGAVTPAGALMDVWVQNTNPGTKYKQPTS